jgi:hypothetical protein
LGTGIDAADLARRLLDEVELRQKALSCPADVVHQLGLGQAQLHEAARLLEPASGPGGDAARAVLFALLAATPTPGVA